MKNSVKALLIVATIIVAMLIISQHMNVVKLFEGWKTVFLEKIDSLFKGMDEKIVKSHENHSSNETEYHFQQ